MRFIIKRTSGEHPHPNAILWTVARRNYFHGYRSVSDMKKEGCDVFGEGKNVHTINYKEKYIIEIDDVLEFVKENGECIIKIDKEYDFPLIEIYDDYRE